MGRKAEIVPRWNEVRQRWELQPYINGKRKTITSKKPGKAGAQECKRKFNLLLSDDRRMQGRSETLRNVFEAYLKDIDARKGEGSNARRTAEQIGRINILPAIGGKKIESITEQDLQRILNNAKPFRRQESVKMLSKKTVMNIRAEINLLFKFLRKSGMTTLVPTDLEIPEKYEFKEKNILQRDEIRILLSDRSRDEPYLPAWQFMVLYGLRPGEVYGLQWRDIEGDHFTIHRSINARSKITPGKNKNARRTEYLFPLALEILERAKERQIEEHHLSPWIFTSQKGKPLRGNQSARRLRDYCDAKGITRVTPYRLRHSFVRIMKSVLTEGEMKLIVGHSDAMDTFGIYGGRLDDDHVITGKKMAEFFGKLMG